MVDAKLTPEMLETIFAPRSPLHDGAVIIRHDRIVAAAAVLPLSETSTYRERFGTRHRAALGITEQTDAVAVVSARRPAASAWSSAAGSSATSTRSGCAGLLVELLEHNTLSAARIPARANALRRTLPPLRRPVRRRRGAEAGGHASAGSTTSSGTHRHVVHQPPQAASAATAAPTGGRAE